jgi:hypothetical protein
MGVAQLMEQESAWEMKCSEKTRSSATLAATNPENPKL